MAHLALILEGDLPRWGVTSAEPLRSSVPTLGRVSHVLVDGVGGHAGDVLSRLRLDVECDEAVRHQVMD